MPFAIFGRCLLSLCHLGRTPRTPGQLGTSALRHSTSLTRALLFAHQAQVLPTLPTTGGSQLQLRALQQFGVARLLLQLVVARLRAQLGLLVARLRAQLVLLGVVAFFERALWHVVMPHVVPTC